MGLKPFIRVPELASVFSTLPDALLNASVHTDYKGNDAGKVGQEHNTYYISWEIEKLCNHSNITEVTR